jgi:hypothetical protein
LGFACRSICRSELQVAGGPWNSPFTASPYSLYAGFGPAKRRRAVAPPTPAPLPSTLAGAPPPATPLPSTRDVRGLAQAKPPKRPLVDRTSFNHPVWTFKQKLLYSLLLVSNLAVTLFVMRMRSDYAAGLSLIFLVQVVVFPWFIFVAWQV